LTTGSKEKEVFEFPTFYPRYGRISSSIIFRGNKTNRASARDERNWKGLIDYPEGIGSRKISKMANVLENCTEVFSLLINMD